MAPPRAGPGGRIADTSVMRRRLPHDLTNALAASALVIETGLATPHAIGKALATFEAPEHRLEPVVEVEGAHVTPVHGDVGHPHPGAIGHVATELDPLHLEVTPQVDQVTAGAAGDVEQPARPGQAIPHHGGDVA